MADDQNQQIQPQAGPANPQNLVNVKELKTLFSNPKVDIPIFMETTQETMLLQNSCITGSKLCKLPTTGQIRQRPGISNWTGTLQMANVTNGYVGLPRQFSMTNGKPMSNIKTVWNW
jgi:hypothetical protein